MTEEYTRGEVPRGNGVGGGEERCEALLKIHVSKLVCFPKEKPRVYKEHQIFPFTSSIRKDLPFLLPLPHFILTSRVIDWCPRCQGEL